MESQKLHDYLEIIKRFKWFDLNDRHSFKVWREVKHAATQLVQEQAPVELTCLGELSLAEKNELARRCETANYSVYASPEADSNSVRAGLRQLAGDFGLKVAEKHRSAEQDGIVLLEPSTAAAKRGYIPYSTRYMNWHTDGYYNAPDQRISAMLLHCGKPALSGGVNQFLDPEIVYLALRDKNPDFVRAMMEPDAMTIPPNTEADGSVRHASVGPVFFADQGTGRLQMRYTARTRSIEWRDDPLTREAEACLREVMADLALFTLNVKLKAGQGVLCNNVLHNRTGFGGDKDADVSRLMYRVRFHNRIEWSS